MYDVNGNVTQIKDAAGVIQYQYTYDSLGQLIREDNRPMNATYTWTYDDAGNIQYKTTYAFTTGTLGSSSSTTYYGYEYDTGWDDRLISYNGLPIRYDEIGNPTKIVTNQYWASSSNWEEYAYELEWEGRQLIGRRFYELYSGCDIWYDEYYDIWFEYNADGIRTSKTAYGVEYKYILNGTQIIGETWTLYGTEYLLLYIYDETGAPIGIKYRTDDYAVGVFDYFFFEKNLQGDIVAIYNAEGEKIGSYVYDAWGNFTVSTVSGNTTLENKIVNDYNPFRYRGYYYDKVLGWYYLQSRYYNPQWGRFVNADGVANLGVGDELLSYNLFAYCGNNPIMNTDYTGCFHVSGFLVGAGIAIAGLALILATAGTATPAVVAMAGLVVGSSVVSTGVTMMGTAATDSVMVMDVSASNSDGVKEGLSLVLDFGESTYDLYSHAGVTAAIGGSPITFSSGVVFNYEKPGDYGGPFVNMGGSIDWLSMDYCRSPDIYSDSVSALSLTFGLPGTKKIGGYAGWDNYRQITSGGFW